MPVRLPSVDVPESEKRRFSEADVLAKLFEPDMRTLGYPPHDATQADGEHFLEQGRLAVNRLKSGSGSGFFDGLYLIGNAPVVLCEIKRYDAIDVAAAFDRAKQQLIDYARSEDFAEPPPFLVLYSGKPERTRFFVRKTVSEPSLLGERDYEELGEIWSWERVKEFQLRGAFALEVVGRDRLREILLYHLDRIEDDLRPQVNQAIQVVKDGASLAARSGLGRWLRERPEALARMRLLSLGLLRRRIRDARRRGIPRTSAPTARSGRSPRPRFSRT
jgi:hypothetical protein